MGKTVILGNTWHGNWSLSLFEEMKRLGHNVEHIDVRIEKYFAIHRLEALRRQIHFRRLNQTLFTRFARGDVDTCIVITPYTLPVSLLEHIKEYDVRLIGWWGDNPMTKANLSEHMPLFDRVFLVDETWVDHARFFNPHTFYLPHAASPYTFKPRSLEKKYDVSFVGASFDGDMNGIYRARTLMLLQEHGISVALFGDVGWKRFSALKDIYQGPVESSEELNRVYNESHISLNIHHSQLITGTNQRSFEAALSGTFQIADNRDSIGTIFGDSIPTYNTTEELVSRIASFIKDDVLREEHAAQAHTIAQEHTYEKRIDVLLGD